jgi:hypothetical protein
VILTSFGGGSYTKQRLGVAGGDVLAGASFMIGAGRIGTGRGPERERDPFMLYGAQVGVTYWPITGYVPHAGIVGLEFQSNYSNYLGEWHNDMRFMVTLNLSALASGLSMIVRDEAKR